MKKYLLLAIIGMFSVSSFAQIKSGLRFGIQANSGYSNVMEGGDKYAFGYGLGAVIEYNFDTHYHVATGIGLQNLAYTKENTDRTVNELFIQLPVQVGSRYYIGDNSWLFVQVGPTIGVGLFRFDLGVGGRLGIEHYGFQFSVGGDYGALQASEDIKGYYHSFSANVKVAYMFH